MNLYVYLLLPSHYPTGPCFRLSKAPQAVGVTSPDPDPIASQPLQFNVERRIPGLAGSWP